MRDCEHPTSVSMNHNCALSMNRSGTVPPVPTVEAHHPRDGPLQMTDLHAVDVIRPHGTRVLEECHRIRLPDRADHLSHVTITLSACTASAHGAHPRQGSDAQLHATARPLLDISLICDLLAPGGIGTYRLICDPAAIGWFMDAHELRDMRSDENVVRRLHILRE